jgi:hypothetical protein
MLVGARRLALTGVVNRAKIFRPPENFSNFHLEIENFPKNRKISLRDLRPSIFSENEVWPPN